MGLRIKTAAGDWMEDIGPAITLAVAMWFSPLLAVLEIPGVSTKAMKEYKLFLSLKLALKDSRNSLLAPSKMADRVWHKHILKDTFAYEELCKALCGSMIHHKEVTQPDELRRMYRNYKKCRIVAKSEVKKQLELRHLELPPEPRSPNDTYSDSDDSQGGVAICA